MYFCGQTIALNYDEKYKIRPPPPVTILLFLM